MNKGKVKICITGKNVNLYVKRLLLNNINFYKQEFVSKEKVYLLIDYENLDKINMNSNIYEIKIVKYYGIVRLLYNFKSNIVFIICFLLSILFLFLISNICFDINIIHSNKKLRNLIYDELRENDIKLYGFIPNFDKRKKIINKIIKNNKDKIEWLEIKRKGSKLIVNLTERKKNPENENLKNRHITAKKSGIIKKIEASNGVIIKKVNDYVSEGEVIISGDIIKDDTVKGQVASKGEVYAETWYKVNVEYPLYYEEIKYLNEEKYNIIISFLNNKLYLRKNFEQYYFDKEFYFIKEKIFPFKIGVQNQIKIKKVKQKLNANEALKKASAIAVNKIKKQLDENEYIISKKTLNFYMKDSKIVVDVFFKIYENITDYKDVDEIIEDN